MDIDEPKTSPVVGDWMPRSPILTHREREQVKARLFRVLPALLHYDMLRWMGWDWIVGTGVRIERLWYQMSLLGQILNVNQPWWFAVKSNTTGITEPCIRFRIQINQAHLTYFMWHTYNCVVFFLYCAVWTEGTLEHKSDCVPMFFWFQPCLSLVRRWPMVSVVGLRSSDLLTTDFIAVLGDKAGRVLSYGRDLKLMD